METILIATDFSTAARNATRYGFELAKAIKAKVILFTAHPGSPEEFSFKDVEKYCYGRLVDEAEAFDPMGRVALETQCRQGNVTGSVLSVAAENNVSFIIVGMKVKGKEMRKVFGSTITFLKKESTIPLIVVPEKASFSVPKAIALASDTDTGTDVHILEPLKRIAESFSSKLFIVHVIKNSGNQAFEKLMRSKRLSSFFTNIEASYEFPEEENVARALKKFVRQHAVDLIAAVPHEHTFAEKLFNRSVTKDLVFHTHVPLLILPCSAAEKTPVRKRGMADAYAVD